MEGLNVDVASSFFVVKSGSLHERSDQWSFSKFGANIRFFVTASCTQSVGQKVTIENKKIYFPALVWRRFIVFAAQLQLLISLHCVQVCLQNILAQFLRNCSHATWHNLMNVSLCPQHICSCQLQAFYRVGNSWFIYSVKFSFLTLNLNLMTRYTQRMCCQKMFLSSFGEIVIQILLIPPAEEDTDKRPKIILTNVKSLPLCDLTDGWIHHYRHYHHYVHHPPPRIQCQHTSQLHQTVSRNENISCPNWDDRVDLI